jgi:hypothetical protein
MVETDHLPSAMRTDLLWLSVAAPPKVMNGNTQGLTTELLKLSNSFTVGRTREELEVAAERARRCLANRMTP